MSYYAVTPGIFYKGCWFNLQAYGAQQQIVPETCLLQTLANNNNDLTTATASATLVNLVNAALFNYIANDNIETSQFRGGLITLLATPVPETEESLYSSIALEQLSAVSGCYDESVYVESEMEAQYCLCDFCCENEGPGEPLINRSLIDPAEPAFLIIQPNFEGGSIEANYQPQPAAEPLAQMQERDLIKYNDQMQPKTLCEDTNLAVENGEDEPLTTLSAAETEAQYCLCTFCCENEGPGEPLVSSIEPAEPDFLIIQQNSEGGPMEANEQQAVDTDYLEDQEPATLIETSLSPSTQSYFETSLVTTDKPLEEPQIPVDTDYLEDQEPTTLIETSLSPSTQSYFETSLVTTDKPLEEPQIPVLDNNSESPIESQAQQPVAADPLKKDDPNLLTTNEEQEISAQLKPILQAVKENILMSALKSNKHNPSSTSSLKKKHVRFVLGLNDEEKTMNNSLSGAIPKYKRNPLNAMSSNKKNVSLKDAKIETCIPNHEEKSFSNPSSTIKPTSNKFNRKAEQQLTASASIDEKPSLSNPSQPQKFSESSNSSAPDSAPKRIRYQKRAKQRLEKQLRQQESAQQQPIQNTEVKKISKKKKRFSNLDELILQASIIEESATIAADKEIQKNQAKTAAEPLAQMQKTDLKKSNDQKQPKTLCADTSLVIENVDDKPLTTLNAAETVSKLLADTKEIDEDTYPTNANYQEEESLAWQPALENPEEFAELTYVVEEYNPCAPEIPREVFEDYFPAVEWNQDVRFLTSSNAEQSVLANPEEFSEAPDMAEEEYNTFSAVEWIEDVPILTTSNAEQPVNFFSPAAAIEDPQITYLLKLVKALEESKSKDFELLEFLTANLFNNHRSVKRKSSSKSKSKSRPRRIIYRYCFKHMADLKKRLKAGKGKKQQTVYNEAELAEEEEYVDFEDDNEYEDYEEDSTSKIISPNRRSIFRNRGKQLLERQQKLKAARENEF